MSDGRQLRSSSSKSPEPPESGTATTGCICGKKVTKTAKKVKCKNCCRVCHADCVALTGLSPTSLSTLTMWVCPLCLVFHSGYSIDSLPPALIADLVTVITAEVQSAGIMPSNGPSESAPTTIVPAETTSPEPANTTVPSLSFSDALVKPIPPPTPSANVGRNLKAQTGDESLVDDAETVCCENQWHEVRPRKSSNPRSTQSTPSPPVSKPPEPEVHRMTIFCEDTKSTMTEVRAILRDIPARAFEKEGKLTLLFDKQEYKDAAAGLLRVALDSAKIQTHSGVKVTVFNLPVPEDLDNQQALEYVMDGLKRKNEDLLKSSKFKIVYAKRHVRKPELMNIRLLVTPEERESLIKRGRLNFDLTRCRVEPHAHYKQCFHCQRPGHSQDCCPCMNDPATCMYCAKAHKTTACPTKEERNTHKCSNCNSSTHHAGYQGCPTLLKHKMEEAAKSQLRATSSGYS